MVHAQPLKIWLKDPSMPYFLRDILSHDMTAFLFSYGGFVYDLCIPFLLWNKKTRKLGILSVVIFHTITWILFPIGMFPLIMIACAFLFVTDEEWLFILKRWRLNALQKALKENTQPSKWTIQVLGIVIAFQLGVQMLLPARRFLYQEDYLWTERNFRFGWNVMVAHKVGFVTFKVTDLDTQASWLEFPDFYLEPVQVKYMSYQGDMIWQFGQYLKELYTKKGLKNISITADCWVKHNQRLSRRYLPENLDILSIAEHEIYDHVLK